MLEGKGGGLQQLSIDQDGGGKGKGKGKNGSSKSGNKLKGQEIDENGQLTSKNGKELSIRDRGRTVRQIDPRTPVTTVRLEAVADVEEILDIAVGAVDAVWEALQGRDIKVLLVE